MSWRSFFASDADDRSAIGDRQSFVSTKTMLIAAAFLFLTVVLALLRPGIDRDDKVVSGTYRTEQAGHMVPHDSEVTRADVSLIDLSDLSAAEAISRQLRVPVRQTEERGTGTHDLHSLTAAVLEGFGHRVSKEDRLQSMLVQALTEMQSNAYIDARLNTALAQQEFVVPVPLRMNDGRLNTNALLTALVRQSRG